MFAHIPLWSVYPDWGWGTADSAEALSYLKRFGSVTVLNGRIHQVMQKVEDNVTFHTSMSTAFPQPAPGTAKSPGPMKVPDEKLKSAQAAGRGVKRWRNSAEFGAPGESVMREFLQSVLGITNVQSVRKNHSLAVVDLPLDGA